MNNKPISTIHCFSFLLVSLLLSQLAFAEQYDQGNKRHQKHVNSNREEVKNYNSDRRENHNRRGGYSHDDPGVSVGVYFGDQHRTYTHDYYQEEFQSGHCPPGLAKKHNGCIPPGQERRWHRGYRLPRDVIFYDISPSLALRLGAPPPRHRYVRVAADILLITIGTGLVVDAIEDLGGM
jgi:Ni/Co efflux regulator RcnB